MKVFSETDFKLVPIPGRFHFPDHSISLIAKATFDLVPGGVVQPSEEQLFPTGDLTYEDDDEGTGSLRYANDFAYFKPRADLLLVGTCHAPGGGPTSRCPVSFRVGDRRRELVVVGDRIAKGPAGLGGDTNPEPFEALELRYERSYGGPRNKENPVGCGQRETEEDQGPWSRHLPNIEDPERPSRRPLPVGFGPLRAEWKTRAAKTGSYNKRWLEERWPWLPEDFDYGYFNAADPALQVEGYLRGDETLEFENLHPEHPRYESALPGLRIRCFVNERVAEGEEASAFRFHEVAMNLDTLWVDADAEQLVLVWRGVADVQTDEFEEIEHAYLLAEALADAPAPLDQCHADFERLREEAAAEDALEDPAAEDDAEESEEPDPVEDAAEETPVDAVVEEVSGQVLGILGAAGLSTADLPFEDEESLGEAIRSQVTESLESSADDAADLASDRASDALVEVAEQVSTPSLEQKRQQLQLLQELGVDDAEMLLADPGFAGVMASMGSAFEALGVDPSDLSSIVEQAKNQPELAALSAGDEAQDPANDEDEQPRIRPLTREILEAEAARGEDFEDEDLSGLDLSNLQLSGIDFSACDFSGANLTGADLSACALIGCNFEGATLETANLQQAVAPGANFSRANGRGAQLAEADLTGASFVEANFETANFDEATLAEAQMQRAELSGIEARETWFAEADLEDAVLNWCDLSKANLSDCSLPRASFRRAKLMHATFEDANCEGADFRRGDLTGLRASGAATNFSNCRLDGVEAAGAVFAEANLVGADLNQANLQGAGFTRANLRKAVLDRADLTGARLIRADLSEAALYTVNLFEASLEKANLTRTVLRGSNLYGAELVDVILDETDLASANLRMTKLA